MSSFDLRTEPWIPVTTRDGMVETLGLEAVIARSHELRQVVGANPPETASLLRLLVGLAHDLLNDLADAESWAEQFGRGKFSADAVQSYFKRTDVSSGLDLFDQQRPFWQHPELSNVDPKTGSDRPVRVTTLLLAEASGNNRTLFSHRMDNDEFSLTPAEAARVLVTAQFFSLGGLNKKTTRQYGYQKSFYHAPLVHGMPTLAWGDTLYETLMLNMFSIAERVQGPLGGRWAQVLGTPPWRWNGSIDTVFSRVATSEVPTVPRDYLDLLLPWSRYIRLVPESGENGTIVRHVHIAQGTAWSPELEPWFALRPESTGERYVPVALQPERAVWRESGAFLGLQTRDNRRYIPPLSLTLYAQRQTVFPELNLQPTAQIVVLPLAKDKAKPQLWRHERLGLPVLQHDSVEERHTIQAALEAIEGVAGTLRAALERFFREMLHDNDRRRTSEASQRAAFHRAMRTYWAAVELPFRQFLVAETRDPPFISTVTKLADEAFRQFLNETVGEDVRLFRAMSLAQGQLKGSLAKKLKQGEEVEHAG